MTRRSSGGRLRGYVEGDDRGVSPQVGIVLLFGLVFLGGALLFMTGSVALDAFEEQSRDERAEQEMDTLRHELATAQLGEPQTVSDVGVESDGTITLTLNEDENASIEMEIGSMRKTADGSTYTYQAGGILKRTDGGSRVVTDPKIAHEKRTIETNDGSRKEVWTIELPPIQIESQDGERSGEMTVAYEDRNLEQRLIDGLPEDERVETLTIEIEGNAHADAWYRFLERELGGEATVERNGDTVTATNIPLGTVEEDIDYTDPSHLVSALDAETIDPPGSIYTADSLWIQHAEVDSFDSAEGPYDPDDARSNGVIMASGEVNLQRQTTVHGDVLAGDGITGTSRITGEYNESWEGFVEPADMTPTLTDIVDGVAAARDTAGVQTPDVESGSHELESGVYYLDSGTISGDLTLDVSGGHVVIVVEDQLRIDGDVSVEGVDSGYEAHWITTDAITVEDRASITVENDRTPHHWFHSLAADESTINARSTFTGVLYTPGDDISIRGGNNNDPTEVYGGLVGNVEAGGRGNHVQLSFDEDLTDEDVSLSTGGGTATSHQAFDATVTFLDADFATPANRGETGELAVDRPLTTVENPDDDLDSLEYWQTASSVADQQAVGFTQTVSGVSESWYSGCRWFAPCSDTQEFDGLAGDEVVIDAETREAGDATVRLSGPGVSETGSTEEPIETELPETGTYTLEIETDYETAYDVVIETNRSEYYYEEVRYEGTQYDTVALEAIASNTDLVVEVVDPDGTVIAIDDANGTSSFSYDNTAFGTYTIRIGGRESAPFDYDLTLERTSVDSAAPTMSQAPIEATMIFETADGRIVEPMTPETDLAAESDGVPATSTDVNHPAVEYPLTYEFEDLPPDTTFTVEMDYREEPCDDHSFAGTTRTPGGSSYEDDPIFELGCGAGSNSDMQANVNALDLLENADYENEQFHRVRALEDGDPVPPIQPVDGQRTLHDMLGPHLRPSNGETEYEMDLAPNERAFVFELSRDAYEDCDGYDRDSPDWGWRCGLDNDGGDPSYNDAVVLFEINPVVSDDSDDASDAPIVRPPDGGDDDTYHYAIQMDGGVITVEGN